MHLENRLKSLNFKIKFKALKVLEFQCQLNSLRRTAKEKEQTQRPSGKSSPDAEELKKDMESRLFSCTECSPCKMRNLS